jgi:hypothetical protein
MTARPSVWLLPTTIQQVHLPVPGYENGRIVGTFSYINKGIGLFALVIEPGLENPLAKRLVARYLPERFLPERGAGAIDPLPDKRELGDFFLEFARIVEQAADPDLALKPEALRLAATVVGEMGRASRNLQIVKVSDDLAFTLARASEPLPQSTVEVTWGSHTIVARKALILASRSGICHAEVEIPSPPPTGVRGESFYEKLALTLSPGPGIKEKAHHINCLRCDTHDDQTLTLSGNPLHFGLIHNRSNWMYVSGVDPRGMVDFVLRQGQIPAGEIKIYGLKEQPVREFVVISPIDGLGLQSALDVGGVSFGPYNGVPYINQIQALLKERYQVWTDFEVWAVCRVTGNNPYDAMMEALRRVDLAMSVLVHAARNPHPVEFYGLGDTYRPWRRDRVIPRPVRTDWVYVRDVANNQLLTNLEQIWEPRTLQGDDLRETLADGVYSRLLVPYADRKTRQKAAALLNSLGLLRRAYEEQSISDQIIFMSNALEFALAGVSAPSNIPEEVRKAVGREARKTYVDYLESFPVPERGNLASPAAIEDKLLSSLSEAPLLARLRFAQSRWNIPLGDYEWELIERCRKARNSLVHASGEPVPLEPEDMRKLHAAISKIVLARAKAEIPEVE